MSLGWVIVLCVLGAAGLLFALSYALMCAACLHSRKMTENLDREIQRATFARHAEQIGAGIDWFRQQPSREVQVRSYDGLTLYGRFLPHENARGTILLFHGWRSAGLLDFSCGLKMYYEQGLNLLLVDQRSHGKSEGRYITYGVRERHDVRTWVEWHNRAIGAHCPVLLGGLSMGATTVLMACGEALPKNVRGVIADCGFTSPDAIIRKVISDRKLPSAPIAAMIDWQTRLFAGFRLKEYSTLTAMRSNRLPTLLVHGEGDAFVPCEMSRQAYDACAAADKTLLTVPHAGHGQSYLLEPERYGAVLRDFIDRALATHN